ncbi:hypothetical protein [Streptococcus pseudoporcinus]|uniref:Uncharacterized protein n=1 Tax=Streptococcus pseudoporcinus LQ 940-04 TaxID=875093 RepID=G5KBT3_9STRE|nr:hypothetical protein [Streptococcus pseudoporcinus]EFR45282.1 hypothetical protein HMPREF9320_1555 [Streptococcus pseudoporcinus SPIN 20026]EHI65211.1 hypothetical protein STRPS_1806 [Streptococcus pseudoporcinus LQ 940-04]VEF92935.1 Uncharacterised protein [Streptococcus pseudoporcinus]
MKTIRTQLNDPDYDMLKERAELSQKTIEEIAEEFIHNALVREEQVKTETAEAKTERTYKDHDEVLIDNANKPENQSVTAPEIAGDIGITI